MGADLSTDEAVFAQKYRERFGEDANPDDLLEQYRYEKLRRDQELRAEELQRQRENERSKSDDEQYYRKKQEENYKIMRDSYDRSRESRDYYRRRGESDRHRSHRSRRHRDDDYRRRRSSRRRDSRDRSRSRRSRSTSRSSDEKENRRRSRKSRSSQKGKRDSSSDEDKRKSKSGSRKKKTSAETSKPNQGKVKKKKKKKKQSAEIQSYQSAPDLTEMDRQYGRGPWWRTHEYFGRYEQGPQSWIQQLSQQRDGAYPTPVMERQIVYGLPSTSVAAVDGLGYPLKEKSPDFQPGWYTDEDNKEITYCGMNILTCT